MSFFDSRRVGELLSRITSDVGTLQDIFSFTLCGIAAPNAHTCIGHGRYLLSGAQTYRLYAAYISRTRSAGAALW